MTLSFENVKWEKRKWLQIFVTYLWTLENSKNGLRSYPCCHWWIRYLNFYTASFCCEESTLHIQNHARRIADLDSTSCKKKTFKCIYKDIKITNWNIFYQKSIFEKGSVFKLEKIRIWCTHDTFNFWTLGQFHPYSGGQLRIIKT